MQALLIVVVLATRAYLIYLRVWVNDLKELDTFGFYLQMGLIIYLMSKIIN